MARGQHRRPVHGDAAPLRDRPALGPEADPHARRPPPEVVEGHARAEAAPPAPRVMAVVAVVAHDPHLVLRHLPRPLEPAADPPTASGPAFAAAARAGHLVGVAVEDREVVLRAVELDEELGGAVLVAEDADVAVRDEPPVDDGPAVDGLEGVAGQGDHPLDELLRPVLGELEDRHVSALGGRARPAVAQLVDEDVVADEERRDHRSGRDSERLDDEDAEDEGDGDHQREPEAADDHRLRRGQPEAALRLLLAHEPGVCRFRPDPGSPVRRRLLSRAGGLLSGAAPLHRAPASLQAPALAVGEYVAGLDTSSTVAPDDGPTRAAIPSSGLERTCWRDSHEERRRRPFAPWAQAGGWVRGPLRAGLGPARLRQRRERCSTAGGRRPGRRPRRGSRRGAERGSAESSTHSSGSTTPCR